MTSLLALKGFNPLLRVQCCMKQKDQTDLNSNISLIHNVSSKPNGLARTETQNIHMFPAAYSSP